VIKSNAYATENIIFSRRDDLNDLSNYKNCFFYGRNGNFAVAAILMAVTLFASAFACHAIAGERKITILYTNDTHSHLDSFDIAEVGKGIGGIERRAEYIKSVKKNAKNVLAVDAGDFFQETPYFAFFKGEADAKAIFQSNYDALTIGNHEFDAGVEKLVNTLKTENIPAVCCNLFNSDGHPLFRPFLMKNIAGLKIAVIGTLGNGAWSVVPKKSRAGLIFADAVTHTGKLVGLLRKHFDLIIVLSHSGLKDDQEMAIRLAGADVIIGGHSHTQIKEPVLVKNGAGNGLGGTIVTQDFKWGAFVGRLVLTFGDDGRLVSYENAFVPMDSKIKTPKNSAVKKTMERYRREINSKVREVVGECPDGMPYDEIAASKTEFALGTYVCGVMMKATGSDFGFINASGVRGSLPPGRVTIEDVMKIVPFDNSIVSCEMTGAQVMAMFDGIAANFGGETGLQYAGVSFNLDLSSKRISALTIGGRPVDPQKTYKLCTISYLAEGNLNGAVLLKDAVNLNDSGVFLRDGLLEHIRANKTIEPPATGNFSIK